MSDPDDLAPIGRALEQAYDDIQRTRMQGLPILNAALRVQAVGLREWDGLCVCVMVTPWCMNLLVLPRPGVRELPPAQPGTTHAIELPTGGYDLLAAHMPPFGHYLSGSLYSPMDAFGNQEQAVRAALDALALMFDGDAEPPEPAAAVPPPVAVPADVGSRRRFLTGRPTR